LSAREDATDLLPEINENLPVFQKKQISHNPSQQKHQAQKR
jgi:hypothetical protein